MADVPDVNSPGFRNAMYNHFLELQERLTETNKMLELIHTTEFKDLTPEIWARIHLGVPPTAQVALHVAISLQSTGFFMDDPETMTIIAEKAHKSLHSNEEN
jgi:hypothetical protein